MKYNIFVLAAIILWVGIIGCKKTGADSGISINPALPTVTTKDATNITGTNATVGGNITNDGGSLITEAGIVYSTTSGVDTTKTRIRNYTISGNYSVTLPNLALLTRYYNRAYEINKKGIIYC